MKPLLTLTMLFVCLMARGQDDMYPHNNWEVIEFIDDYGSTKVVDSMTVITFEMMLDYAEECYNDSTGHCIATFNGRWTWPCEQTAQIDKPYVTEQWIYTHRTPTFEGFIEYLKRKLKK